MRVPSIKQAWSELVPLEEAREQNAFKRAYRAALPLLLFPQLLKVGVDVPLRFFTVHTNKAQAQNHCQLVRPFGAASSEAPEIAAAHYKVSLYTCK